MNSLAFFIVKPFWLEQLTRGLRGLLLVILLFVSFVSVGQIFREPVQTGKIPFAGMLIIINKDHPFPKCEDFAKLNWDALRKRHNELKSRAIQSHEVTIIYPGNKKIYLTFDQLKEIACK